MTKQRAVILSVIAGIVLVVAVAGIYKWWRATHPGNVVPQPVAGQGAQDLSPEQQQKQREDAQTCLNEALQRIYQEEHEETEQHDDLELEKHWLEYLQRIQAEGNYQNWSDRPCDLYLRNHPNRVNQAVAQGFAAIVAEGNGLHTVKVTVTSTANNPVLYLPVGTLFTSPSNSTQSMISAESVRFVFHPVKTDDSTSQNIGPARPGKPRLQLALLQRGTDYRLRNVAYVETRNQDQPQQSQTQEISSYCINRWLDVPESNVQFTISQPDQSSSLRKLVSCLANTSADHEAKQHAVWMVSDGLMDLTQQELEEKIIAYSDEHLPRSVNELAAIYKKAKPDASDEEIRLVENMTPEEFGEWRTNETNRSKKLAQDDLKYYLEIARPLLEGCGIDLSGKALF